MIFGICLPWYVILQLRVLPFVVNLLTHQQRNSSVFPNIGSNLITRTLLPWDKKLYQTVSKYQSFDAQYLLDIDVKFGDVKLGDVLNVILLHFRSV